jgi:hypothetical protein
MANDNRAFAGAIAVVGSLAAALPWSPPCLAGGVAHSIATVNGTAADVWSWPDANDKPRSVALKIEGDGNSGHGGYAIQMTYYRQVNATRRKVAVDADSGNDGGFGYFVSHERYRYFKSGVEDTIAGYIFHRDDSPLGLDFPAVAAIPLDTAAAGIESFSIRYGHYGTTVPWGIDSDTGLDSPPLPTAASAFAFYTIPVTTSWVFEAGKDFPRIDVSVDLSRVIAPGTTTPAAGWSVSTFVAPTAS